MGERPRQELRQGFRALQVRFLLSCGALGRTGEIEACRKVAAKTFGLPGGKLRSLTPIIRLLLTTLRA